MTIDQIIKWEANHVGCDAEHPRACICPRPVKTETTLKQVDGEWVPVEETKPVNTRNVTVCARKEHDESPESWALHVITSLCYLEQGGCAIGLIYDDFGLVLFNVTRADGTAHDLHGLKGVRESTARLLDRSDRDAWLERFLSSERTHREDDDRDIILAEVYTRLGALTDDLRLDATGLIETLTGLTH